MFLNMKNKISIILLVYTVPVFAQTTNNLIATNKVKSIEIEYENLFNKRKRKPPFVFKFDNSGKLTELTCYLCESWIDLTYDQNKKIKTFFYKNGKPEIIIDKGPIDELIIKLHYNDLGKLTKKEYFNLKEYKDYIKILKEVNKQDAKIPDSTGYEPGKQKVIDYEYYSDTAQLITITWFTSGKLSKTIEPLNPELKSSKVLEYDFSSERIYNFCFQDYFNNLQEEQFSQFDKHFIYKRKSNGLIEEELAYDSKGKLVYRLIFKYSFYK